MSFDSLGFAPDLLPFLARALEQAGVTAPSPVQARAIPPLLQGLDVLIRAPTGSGKTAAFALPLLQRCAQAPRCTAQQLHALVLVPTRELATQVSETLVQLGSQLPQRPRVATAIGGVSLNPQLKSLRGGAEIVVATPGRLLDLVQHNALRLDTLSTLVLDEADQLLALGFGDELDAIQKLLPARRQTVLVSATLPDNIAALARRLLHAPQQVDGDDSTQPPPDITQRAIEVDPQQRTALLRHLLQEEGWTQALVFVASHHTADTVADKLERNGIAAQALHGTLSQGRRQQVLRDFQANALQVVVATDVAARGLDIPALPLVVNYDLPRAAADYTHRIGRTGRAGASGTAISFVSASTEPQLRLIEKRQRVRVPRERVTGFEPSAEAAVPSVVGDHNGGIKGRRPSKKDKLRAAQAAANTPD
ncbi:DEAD/DEAH box helicase [Pseudoxanthomonas sp.]|uniref:DEAD/DEAH box helicase n=1 Tax=Pseudoxanthomonas sp. TaxID=1871049 RepID=UPI002626B18C|nr:DEAD/DEAH box helicase [Pseudoxanthomonas sp.]WDS35575.1 MAG: DEAD/DEAH box helicase [Pseudoxanthomonas sp.]